MVLRVARESIQGRTFYKVKQRQLVIRLAREGIQGRTFYKVTKTTGYKTGKGGYTGENIL
jgi:hypothetical protein